MGSGTTKGLKKDGEEAMRYSEERLRMAQRAGRVGIWDWNIAEHDAYWSETTWELFEQEPQEDRPPDQEAWGSRIHPDDRQRAWDHLHAAVASDSSTYRDEFRLLSESGRIRWIETTADISRDESGIATRLLGVYIDITERKNEEERLGLLAEIGEILRTTSDDVDLLYRVARRVGEYFGAQRCLFNEIDLDGDVETVHRDYFNGVESLAGTHQISEYSPLTSADMAAGKTVANHDSKTDTRTARRYQEVYEPAGERSYVAVPLMRDGKWVASLWTSCDSPHQWGDADVRLLEMIAERAWFGVERQRQKEELEVRVAERTRELAASNRALIDEAKARAAAEQERIQLLHRLMTSQEMERRRIARDIHDQLGQRLTGLRLKLESLSSVVGNEGDIAARVKRLQEISERLDSEVSFLAWELRPTVLDDLGLVEALSTYVREWTRHTDVNAGFQAIKVAKDRFDVNVETHLYRIAQEALNNVTKHAQAEHVTVMLEKRKKELLLIIEDDGKGFDPAKLARPLKSGRGLGLIGMQERSTLIGGELDIESSENGTTIYIRVPVFES